MKRTLLCLTMVFTLVGSELWAQERTVSGKVTSAEDGSGLPGVSVVVKGTTQGVVTDLDGNYSLTIPPSATTLVFTFIGLTTEEVEIGERSLIDVQMTTDTKQLSEIVVVGYTSLKRSDLTSAISTVSGTKLQSQPIASFENLLQGTSPGILVTNQNGRPGGNAYIRIRGVGSINASNEPLFIIDGVQMTQSDYNAINPNDVRETYILKDAASTAIYGARASNGVIVVNTKRGEKGVPLRIDYKFQYGNKEKIPDNFEMMNKEEKLQYETDLGYLSQAEADELRTSLAAPETDWKEVLLRTGTVSSHDLSLSSSSEKASFFMSVSKYGEDGISKASRFDRTSGRLNMDFTPNKWLKFGNSLTIARTKTNDLRDRFNTQNPFFAVYGYNPFEPEFVLDENGNRVLDEDGEPVYNVTRQGLSISEALINNPETERHLSTIGEVFLEVTPLKNLRVKSALGGNYQIYRREYYVYPGSILDSYVGDPNAPGSKTDSGSDRLLSNFTNTLNYNFKIGEPHNFNLLLGTEYIKYDFNSYSVSAKGFPSKEFSTQDNAAEITDGSTTRSQRALWSEFGQINYNLNEKYFASASLRRDGSSRFGSDYRYGLFYSVSAGWNINEENFFPLESIDQLKLRASLGTSGNEPDEFYASRGLYGFASYAGVTSSYPSQLSNPELRWESNFNMDYGIDFGILNNRLTGSVDYYSRKTFDLLFNRPISSTTGFSSRLENVGEVLNTGVEFELKYDIFRNQNFSLSVSGSISTNKNEVKSLENGGEDIINGSSGVTLLREGMAANTYFLVRYAGVNPSNGEALYYDINGELTNAHSYDDAVALEGKSPNPKYYGGFALNAEYKGLFLNANFYYQGGNYIYNYMTEAYLMSDGQNVDINQRRDALNYWKTPGQTNVLPRPDITSSILDSDRYLQKGDFIRLRNIQLGYNLPKSLVSRLKLTNFQVYLQGSNLWTYNPYFTGDPEVGRGSDESNLTLLGEFTLFTYPNTRGYTFGVNLTF